MFNYSEYYMIVFVLLAIPVYSDEPAIPYSPNAPRVGDPNLIEIQDARLLKLWEDTVVTYRWEDPYVDYMFGNWVKNANSLPPKKTEDQLYLLDAFETAIMKMRVDWNYVHTVLIVMQAVMETAPQIPELANRMYKMERPAKMSLAHGFCYKMMIPVLELQQSKEAAALLYDMTQISYWGNGPMLSPVLSKKSTEGSIFCLRSLSVGSLAKFPATVCLPYLEKLAAMYPPHEDYKSKVYIQTSRNRDYDLDFMIRIQNALAQVDDNSRSHQE